MAHYFYTYEMGRGRPAKYKTDAERKAAKKEAAKRYREKKKLEDEAEALLSISPDLYSKKSKSNRKHMKALMNLPLGKPIRVRDKSTAQAKEQLGRASRKNLSCMEFNIDIMDESNKKYFYSRIREFFNDLLDRINLDENNWMIYYEYKGDDGRTIYYHRPLDITTQQFLRDQLEKEVPGDIKRHDIIYEERDYDFFPVDIKELTKIRIINEDVVGLNGNDDVKVKHIAKEFQSNSSFKYYKQLVQEMKGMKGKAKAKQQKIIKEYLAKTLKKQKKKRSGNFWRWYLNFPGLNLERQTIFSRLDKRTAEIINQDNCFIYACLMSGLPMDIINELRYNVKTRTMSTKEVKIAAENCDLCVMIKDETGRTRTINPKGKYPVSLLLMKGHYMINERVKVSPYYILHKDEIMNDRIAKYWPINEKMKIKCKANGYYKKGDDFSLRKVINTLFDIGAFSPITLGDFMTYTTTVCFEEIDHIKDLSYNQKFCCRLKEFYPTIKNGQ